jgi:hypothetical protein
MSGLSKWRVFGAALAASSLLGGCAALKTTARIAAAPVQITYKGAELTAKGFYYSGKYAAIGTWEGAKLAGKGAYYTGKGAYDVGHFGVDIAYNTGKCTAAAILNTMEMAGNGVRQVARGLYYLGAIPLRMTERLLYAANDVIDITVRVLDTAGRVIELTKRVQALALESELAFLRDVPDLVDILLDSEDEIAGARAQVSALR